MYVIQSRSPYFKNKSLYYKCNEYDPDMEEETAVFTPDIERAYRFIDKNQATDFVKLNEMNECHVIPA
jgi:hypothetical protein